MKVCAETIGKIFLIFVLASFVYTTLGQNINLKIVGGADSIRGRWPWQAMVVGQKRKNGPVFSCGATLISDSFLLTSAYCPMGFIRIQVILGMWNFSAEYEKGRRSYSVIGITNHPCFDHNEASSYADIALIQIRTDSRFAPKAQIVCLPIKQWQEDWDLLQHDVDIANCIATGYGVGPVKKTSLGVLNEVEFPHISTQKCTDYYGHLLADDKLCSYGAAGRATCKGDMGGPIVCQGQHANKCGRYFLAGTISNTDSQCDTSVNSNKPSIFTAIFPHIPWIAHFIEGKSLAIACPGKSAPKSNFLSEILKQYDYNIGE